MSSIFYLPDLSAMGFNVGFPMFGGLYTISADEAMTIEDNTAMRDGGLPEKEDR